MTAAALGVDQLVDVREERGRIVIESVCTPAYELDELLDRMMPETFPKEVDFGPRVGGEVW